jgi:F-type H+-transporting ATPase subunit b
MPQISQIAETYLSQLFWLALVFGLIYFVIGRGMLPRIEATVEARDRRISEDLAAAEAARVAAEAIDEANRARGEADRADALKVTAAAKEAAARETEAKVKAADADSRARIEAAEARIRAASEAAMGEVEAVAAEAAQDIVTRLAGISVPRERAAAAVRAALGQG